MAAEHYVGEVVTFRPRVTGGHVVAVVTAVHSIPLFGVSLDIRVTDGTLYYPTGHAFSVFAEVVE